MPFEFTPLRLSGVMLVHSRVFPDTRGYFLETFQESAFRQAGIRGPFVQDNLSRSCRGVLRGIHYQRPPSSQGKLVQVAAGRIWDVCVDLRRRSPSFGEWLGVELGADTSNFLYIPPGFGHGFVCLTDHALVSYKCTAEYDVHCECGVRFDDPELAIRWPLEHPIVSERDAALPPFSQAETFGEMPE